MHLGPKVECLELFENLDTLYLQNNLFNELSDMSFQFNVKLTYLNLSHNTFTNLQKSLVHLDNLNFLDISFNKIGEFEA